MKRRPTTQDISWFLDLNDRGQLNLNPSYQRRSVWTRKDRLFFLDTIFRGYPCPAIFLHQEKDEEGRPTYHVVDGKQRLETIIKFANNELTISRDHSNLELAGKKLKDLDKPLKDSFWDYILTVDMLDIVEQATVDEVFDRLNRNSRKLQRQELRHAKFDGWFISFAEEQSEKKIWQDLTIVSSARTKRMRDVQFISELMIMVVTNQTRGFSQDEIDEFYAEYESPEDLPSFESIVFEEKFNKVRDFMSEMEGLNNCISIYAKNFMHFYTLWSYVSKNIDVLDKTETSTKYLSFMSCLVDEANWESTPYQSALKLYSENSVGANTDLLQRTNRLTALENAFN
jgi:hypothetical protein